MILLVIGQSLIPRIYQGGIIGAFGTALGLALGYAACMGLTTYRFPLDPKT